MWGASACGACARFGPGCRGGCLPDSSASMGGGRGNGKLNILVNGIWNMNGAGSAPGMTPMTHVARELRVLVCGFFYNTGGVMQHDSFRIVWRALVVGLVAAGVAAGAGCSKRSENATDSNASSSSSMAPAPATPPGGGTPGSAAAGGGMSGGATAPGGAMSAPGGAASAPGASGG